MDAHHKKTPNLRLIVGGKDPAAGLTEEDRAMVRLREKSRDPEQLFRVLPRGLRDPEVRTYMLNMLRLFL